MAVGEERRGVEGRRWGMSWLEREIRRHTFTSWSRARALGEPPPSRWRGRRKNKILGFLLLCSCFSMNGGFMWAARDLRLGPKFKLGWIILPGTIFFLGLSKMDDSQRISAHFGRIPEPWLDGVTILFRVFLIHFIQAQSLFFPQLQFYVPFYTAIVSLFLRVSTRVHNNPSQFMIFGKNVKKNLSPTTPKLTSNLLALEKKNPCA